MTLYFATIAPMENTDTQDTIIDANDIDPRVYELGYLLLPTLSEEDAAKEVQVLKDQASSLGGTIVESGTPSLIDLAYSMEKVIENKKEFFDTGYFGWFTFRMLPAKALEFNTLLTGKDTVIRHLLIKASRELPQSKRAVSDAKKGKGEAASDDAGTIDEKIDELVA